MATKLTRNISYLTLSQIANYVLPLVTIPYITRVVGPSNYGLIEFATVVLLYFIVIVDYSFNTTATRKIAAFAHNPRKISLVFSSVIIAKMILFGISLVLFGLLMLLVPTFRENQLILWMAFPIVVGWALYPNFLFNGTQRLGIVALANVMIKGSAALFIFVFINQEKDYYLVPFINGITQVGVGILTLWYVFKVLPGVRWIKPKKRGIIAVIREGRFVFLSNYFTRIYGFSSIFIGGFLLSPVQLGLFAAASKLITVAQSFLFQPLYGALFPFLSQKKSEGMEAFKKQFRKSLLLLFLATSAATLGLILLGPFLVKLIFGNDYSQASQLVTIMAPMLVIGSFVHMHMQQGLLILRQDKIYMTIVVTAGLVSIVLNLLLIPRFQLLGAAYVKLLIEVVIAILATVFFYQKLKKA